MSDSGFTLAELFSMDPREMTNVHLDVIIARYREARNQYNLGAKSPGSAKAIAKKEKATEVDLKALGLLD